MEIKDLPDRLQTNGHKDAHWAQRRLNKFCKEREKESTNTAEEYSDWTEKFTKMLQQLDLIKLLEDMLFEIIKLGKCKEKWINRS